DIHASIKLKTEKGELKMFDASAELGSSKWHAEFKEMFKRSVEQELAIRAMRWAKKKGATHADLESIFLGLPPEKETFQRAIHVGLLSKEGKILKIPRQINLKENRWLEKPIIPRRPIIRKPKRKSVFTRRR
ncbi:MAG: hypothetical protein Q8N60_04880, partial [Candidatus Diapherotrites archaeon]|nr:hypothetical protein [Candidatus Diapherotrites archaeon]